MRELATEWERVHVQNLQNRVALPQQKVGRTAETEATKVQQSVNVRKEKRTVQQKGGFISR